MKPLVTSLSITHIDRKTISREHTIEGKFCRAGDICPDDGAVPTSSPTAVNRIRGASTPKKKMLPFASQDCETNGSFVYTRAQLADRYTADQLPISVKIGLSAIDQYIPPMSGAGAATGAGGSGLSATRDSVVSRVPAMEAAFSRAERVTLVGSTIPDSIMSQYFSL